MNPLKIPKFFTAAYFGYAKARPVAGLATLIVFIIGLICAIAAFTAPSFSVWAGFVLLLINFAFVALLLVVKVHQKSG